MKFSSRFGIALITIIVLACLAAAVLLLGRSPDVENPKPTAVQPSGNTHPLPAARYTGSQTCMSCHADAFNEWKDSHHDLAMMPATPATLLGNFNNARFHANSRSGGRQAAFSEFFLRDDRPYVRAEGPDGRPAEFAVTHTFGITPLQQYLVELPDGYLQAFNIAWDARPKSEGGQRWFDLYANEPARPGDSLHWTGRQLNWNFMCADCHSTNLKKNFDPVKRHFSTSWSEINVSCEACHGPGSNHVSWARQEDPWPRMKRDDPLLAAKGLTIRLDERKRMSWPIDPATGNARRVVAKGQDITATAGLSMRSEIEMCAKCHSRREQFSDNYIPGEPLMDHYLPAVIEEGLYWQDGQMRDEVYNHGSFAQSKMYQAGVTCSDCHNPHTLKLRAPGNQVCFQCHAPKKYESAKHHFHPLDSGGASCAACHMPTTTYMSVDPRHDHSLRIPRPDIAVKIGAPNACTKCHTDRSDEWAAEQFLKWYPNPKESFQDFAMALHLGVTGQGGAAAALLGVIRAPDQSAIARASALALLPRYLSRAALDAVWLGLRDTDAQVRHAAVRAVAGVPADLRRRMLSGMLDDPIRAVRMEAAAALAGAQPGLLDAAQQAAYRAALEEYVAAQNFNADRPEAHLNLARLRADQGDLAGAETSLRTALDIAPDFDAAAVNLADVYSATQRETQAEQVLRNFLARYPNEAAAHHALGLSLVRQQRTPEALPELRRATEVEPGNVRFQYVYAVGLHAAGQTRQAIQRLEDAVQAHPHDRDVLGALSAWLRDAGDMEAAQRYAMRLAELEPYGSLMR